MPLPYVHYKIYINHFNINAIQIESFSNIDYLKRITASKAQSLEKERGEKKGGVICINKCNVMQESQPCNHDVQKAPA